MYTPPSGATQANVQQQQKKSCQEAIFVFCQQCGFINQYTWIELSSTKSTLTRTWKYTKDLYAWNSIQIKSLILE